MLINKYRNKLKFSILDYLYTNYHDNLVNYIDSIVIISAFIQHKKYDEHDIILVLNNMMAENLIKFDGNLSEDIPVYITAKGFEYYHSMIDARKNWFLNHLFDIFNLLIAVVLGTLGIIF